MIELELIISSKDPALEPITVTDFLVFSEAAYWKIDAFRVATGEVLVNGEKINFDADDCIDRTGWCTLEIDSYQGRQRNKVAGYIDPALMDPKVTGATQSGSSVVASSAKQPASSEKDDFNFSPVQAGS